MDFLDPGGIVVPEGSLALHRAKDLVAALRGPGALFASLIECRSSSATETVVFDVEVERPQVVANDIRKTERLAAVFVRDDDTCPDVLALRRDFPALQHQNQRFEELPRSLCLYDRPWSEIRITWTAPAFVERVRWWLKQAARDELHGGDQALEPFLLSWGQWLVLPPLNGASKDSESFLVTLPGGKEGRVFLAHDDEPGEVAAGVVRLVVVRFETPRQRHRVLPRIPRTLDDLNGLLRTDELDLLSKLRERLKNWPKEREPILQNRVILLIDLPKTRTDDGPVERVEHCAVFIDKPLVDLGVAIGVWTMQDGKRALLLVPDASKTGDDVPLSLLNVCHALTRDLAAVLNGHEAADGVKILAVGAGALGSHVAMNLARAGWGRWTVVDCDDLLPHNLARHAAGGAMVGCRKAAAMALEMNWVFRTPETASFIDADVLRPGAEGDRLAAAARGADLILDMSASVAVGRHLTRIEAPARRASLFLSPSGRDLVLLAEDKHRHVELDHLEMTYYTAVATDDRLEVHLNLRPDQVRYGLSCRDVSSRIAQDALATLGGIGGAAIRQLADDDQACIRIWRLDPLTLGVDALSIDVVPLERQTQGDWTLEVAPSLLRHVAGWREQRLPKETGGVLMGNVDHDRRTIYVMLALPSPPDSAEWPCHYIRGCEELRKRVDHHRERTAENLRYVGEWHSHPDGAATMRSGADLKVFSWIAEHTLAEGTPPVMLIAGERGRARIFVGLSENTPEELCPA
ncbi:thiamine biosynthesis protein ThiF [Phycisphaerae bacterium RAS1]|nr:thiamine biosynthesis protein ThiF [Phycisphaerae bacterium RAS1]